MLQQRIDELNNPVSDAARQQYANLLQQYISGLSTADPSITDLIASLQQMATTLGQPGQGEQLAGSLATQYQGLDPEYAKAAQARIAQLQADPYTGAEWEAYRTNALDPIEADRTAAIQRALGNLADRGLNMDSGISQALVGEVNQGFDANRARAQNDLALSRVNQRMARSGEAFDVQTALANMLQGRQLTGLDIARQATADTTGRMGLQAQTYGTLADILPQRSQQQLGAAQSLSQLSGSVRGEEEARRQSAIALQGLLAEMPERRLQLALATLGQGTAPESVINSLMQVAGMANQSQALNNQASQQTWGGLGSLLGYLAPLWSQGSGSAGATGTGGVNWGGINPPKF